MHACTGLFHTAATTLFSISNMHKNRAFFGFAILLIAAAVSLFKNQNGLRSKVIERDLVVSSSESIDSAPLSSKTGRGHKIEEKLDYRKRLDPNSLKLLSEEGVLTYASIRRLDLTREEALFAQNCIHDFQKAIVENARKNLSFDEEESDLDKGIMSYEVSPFIEGYNKIFNKFSYDVSNAIGNAKGLALSEAVLSSSAFRGWGQGYLQITFDDSFVHPGEIDPNYDVVAGTIEVRDQSGNAGLRESFWLDQRQSIYRDRSVLSSLFEIIERDELLLDDSEHFSSD